jgi:holo-[acyl-carrier protein] synthase
LRCLGSWIFFSTFVFSLSARKYMREVFSSMIYGIGIDIVRIERMKAAVSRWGDALLRRLFTEGEIAYAYAKKEPFQSLSVRFAAKEACIKAVGPHAPVSFRDIEVLSDGGGRPVLEVKGRLGEFLRDRAVTRLHVTLSHEREYGVACVVIEGEA